MDSSDTHINNILSDKALLATAIERLALQNEKAARVIGLYYVEGLKMTVVARKMGVSLRQAYRIKSKALRLVEAWVEQQQRGYRGELPTMRDGEIVGVDEQSKVLATRLSTDEMPWIFSVEGLGGIGKTTLAEVVVRRPEVTSHFDTVLWVSAKHQDMLPGVGVVETKPALDADTLVTELLAQFGDQDASEKPLSEQRLHLKRLLKSQRCLAVVDNLETVVDYQTILPILHELIRPSKVLITTRYSLRPYGNIYCHQVRELDFQSASRLIRDELRFRDQTESITDDQLQRIYQVVGGHPLALQLVAGHLSVLPLEHVLSSLSDVQETDVEALYTFIYWQTWQLLTPESQQLLLVMPVAQNGEFDQIEDLAVLSPEATQQAILQLTNLSLLQVSGSLDKRYYSIHRLTERFLLNEAIQWRRKGH